MKKFLERAAEYIYGNYSHEPGRICIIMPGRRGGLFLKKYLSAVAGKTIWAPDIYSVEDFFGKISDLRVIQPAEQLFELFETHKSLNPDNQGTFEEFLSWGPQLLHDFEEIDSYMADPQGLFMYLNEAKAISLWNPDGSPLTDFEKNYLRFFNSLYAYYENFNERLKKRGAGYSGMIFREVANNIAKYVESFQWEKIIITGMNAMTMAEEMVYDHLVKSGKAEFFWDSDVYYTENPQQEAGNFLRQWKRKWGGKEFRLSEDNLSSGSKTIEITGLPDNVGQVKYCGELVGNLCSAENIRPEEIAVVLPDEQLLIPLLNSFPDNVEDVNVTMGLPLRHTPLFSFFDLLIRMHLNVLTLAKSDEEYNFYFRDVTAILRHPYMLRISAGQTSLFSPTDLAASVRKGNKIFYKTEELPGTGSGLFGEELSFLKNIFRPWKTADDVTLCLKQVTEDMLEVFQKEQCSNGHADREYLYSFSLLIHQIDFLNRTYNSISDITTFAKLFLQLAETTKLPFFGEPLKGVQIMGMLETRTLDFKYVIILSVNEGVLPSGKSNHSFIPYEIKKQFGLPTYQNNNSIYAYHFYRLLQHPEKIHLLYNMTGDLMGGGEKSRFINQILQEIPKVNPSVKISQKIAGTSAMKWEPPKPIIVQKEKDVLEKLNEKAFRGLSPSSINVYRKCSLRFYLKEIARIEPPEEPEEIIETNTMGTIIHDVLFDLFLPLKDKIISKDDLKPLFEKVDDNLKASFRKNVPGINISSGKNLLIFNVAGILIRNLLKSESDRIEKDDRYSIAFLEHPFERFMKVGAGKEMIEVKLKGRVDRIDQTVDRWIVLDYKTGKFTQKELKVGDITELVSDPEMEKAFQLMMYAWLFHTTVSDMGLPISSGIISLKNVRSEIPKISFFVNGTSTEKMDKDTMNAFGTVLQEILSELFNPEIPFKQAEDHNVCRFCDYVSFCSR